MTFIASLPSEIVTLILPESPVQASDTNLKQKTKILIACKRCSAPVEKTVEKLLAKKVYCFSCACQLGHRKATLTEAYPQLAELFSKDSPWSADEVSAGGVQKVLIHCSECGIEVWKEVRKLFRSTKCVKCGNQKSTSTCNLWISLSEEMKATLHPDSPVDPSSVLPYDRSSRVWFSCISCSKIRKLFPQDAMVTGPRCQGCSNSANALERTDFETSVAYLHPEKAKLFVDQSVTSKVSPGSQRFVEVRCSECSQIQKLKVQAAVKRDQCQECYLAKCGPSKMELEFRSKLAAQGYALLCSNRTVIFPFELDILIPSHKVAIEFNGEFWHSDQIIMKTAGISAEKYHSKKEGLSEKAGYPLAFVWEDDWTTSPDETMEAVIRFIETKGKDVAPSLQRKISYFDDPSLRLRSAL